MPEKPSPEGDGVVTDLYRDTLQAREQALGPGHVSTEASRRNLAAAEGEARSGQSA
ncbi:MAG TPA: hypothetical protein VFR55_01890 [Dehalococcoidia bacterium]|nr:hypothetical protein [Dehalococcoidia bacterium]